MKRYLTSLQGYEIKHHPEEKPNNLKKNKAEKPEKSN